MTALTAAGREEDVSLEDLELLLRIPSSEWAPVAEGDEGRSRRLAQKGLLQRRPRSTAVGVDEASTAEWDPYAAAYHAWGRWRDIDVSRAIEASFDLGESVYAETLAAFSRKHGDPPPAFHRREPQGELVELPLERRQGDLYDALTRRKTTRIFDSTASLALEQVALLLDYTWGCHGYFEMLEGHVALRKTSPSGGALHPIEVYPLVIGVDALEPGLYHYCVREHALEPVERLSRSRARSLAQEFVAGQTYFADAQVLFVMAARFSRSYWKYRRHTKAYSVVLMDAAHLSQTLQLLCANLGLGAFVTAAINNGDIDDRLGFDGTEEGAVLICGCGVAGSGPPGLEPRFIPYVPRDTVL